MSEQVEFEKWLDDKDKYIEPIDFYPWVKEAFVDGWQACAEQKDREIAALRGFAKDLLINHAYQFIDCSDVYSAAKDNGILDENGNLTKLLTGESE